VTALGTPAQLVMAAAGARVAHRPTSNLFLGSGLYAWRAALEPGRLADLAAWDRAVGLLDAERQRVARGLHERVFAWMTLADERHLAATWVAGQERHRRTTP